MIPEIISSLTLSSSAIAIEALVKAIKKYQIQKGEAKKDLVISASDLDALLSFEADGGSPLPISYVIQESPIEASHSTREIIQTQVTILEAERNRLIPIAAREHWVALIFAVIAGIVFLQA